MASLATNYTEQPVNDKMMSLKTEKELTRNFMAP